MKSSIMAVILMALFACGGGSGSGDTPDVSGTYDLTNTECPGSFDTTVTVEQDGNDIVIQATNDGFNDAIGTIDENGDIDVDIEDGTCTGSIVSGIAVTDCSVGSDSCRVTYEER